MPESVIEQSSEYKILQTKYCLILNDNLKLKQALEEVKQMLGNSRSQFQRQLEQMESDELAQQKRLGNQMMLMEEQLAHIRKENELLRIEYEQNVAANEQTGPINKEMRSLITTLQTNNKLLKSDNVRTKKRCEEIQAELERYKKQNGQLQQQLHHQQHHHYHIKKEGDPKSSAECSTDTSTSSSAIQLTSTSTQSVYPLNNTVIKIESNVIDQQNLKLSSNNEIESNSSAGSITAASDLKCKECFTKDLHVKDLKEQLKKAQENYKEAKTILEVYTKSGNSSNPKYKIELEDAKQEIKKLREILDKSKLTSSVSVSSTSNTFATTSNSSNKSIPTQQISSQSSSPSTSQQSLLSNESNEPKLTQNPSSSSFSITANTVSLNNSSSSSSSTHDYLKKIKSLEETIRDLHKNLSNKKQEEAALLNDMEITGQAFEDMQEQNVRLLQQLREKDDANFKLVSERIKLENVQKILKEEKEIYSQQVSIIYIYIYI
jgi:E3 ubiquitin-protein ligase BRE1